jgi:hypothetical protein
VDPYTAARTGITSFSPFGVGSAGSPLPLDLIAFTGNKNNDGILLKWTTVNEQSTKSFIIERSTDGNTFTFIGEVAAKNMQAKTDYSFNDRVNGLPAVVFYRLKMNDESGREKYSATLHINNTIENGISIYPNPVKDGLLNIQLDRTLTNAVITITNMAGQVVYTKVLSSEEINKGVVPVLVKSLANGNYMLNLNTDNGNIITTTKFIKQ